MCGISLKPASLGERSLASLGGGTASIRPTTLLLGPSKPGKDSPQQVSMPAMPCIIDCASPSQVQVVTAGGMCLTSSSMYSRPRMPSSSPPENMPALLKTEPPCDHSQAVQSQFKE